MTKRRTGQEQRQIVAEWRRSRASAAAFAAEAAVSAASLFRWARLHRRGACSPRGVQLIEAVPIDAGERGPWAWEVETPRGVVRGRDQLDGDRVRAIIEVLVGSSR